MTNKTMIAKAVKVALYSGFAASLAVSAPATFAADEEGADEEAERIVVTGSRLKRTDVEGALPVTVIDREQIDLSGESNAADFLRSLTFNSAGSFRPQSGSSAQGTASISLRGIGSDRTLVLIDGRRLPKSGSTGSTQDLNTIPMAAIERIEVLTDGASAVYGSDAIGGVVNIITRSDFEGVELMYGQQDVSLPADGGDREEGSIVFGAAGDRGNIMAGVSWNDRDIIFARDFPWNTPGGSIYGNSFTTLTGGFDNFNWTSIPDGQGGTACDFAGTGFYTLASPSSITGERCAYDFTLVSADEASIKNKGLFVKADYQINDDWSLYMDTRVTRTESFGRYAPVPDSSFFSTPLSADSPNNPTNPNGNVYDPNLGLAQQEVNWWHRFDALGNRDNTITNNMTDVLFGTTGYIGNVEVDVGYRRTDNKTDDVGRNYLLRSAASNLIESGAYDLSNPYANPEDVLNSMKVTVYRESVFDQEEAYATAQFDLFEMGGGTSSMLLNVEYRKEIYADIYDPLSEAGQIGGSAGNTAGGTRDVRAFAFESIFPFTDNLEMNLAARYDDYSDFGNKTSPKVSFRYQPMDELTLRASYGQGFRAPSLPELTQKPSFSATSVSDPQTCIAQGQPADCSVQINDTIQSNPELGAEESDQYSVGAAYEPTDWLNFTVDYSNIEITNQIDQITAQEIINAELTGVPVPAGLGCDRAPSGAIVECFTGFGNQGKLEVDQFDFNMRLNFEIAGGRLTSQTQWSRVLGYAFDDNPSIVRNAGLPKDRLVLWNRYAISDFTFGYNLNLIGENGSGDNRVPTWVTHDVQFNYDTPWDGRITLGAQNVGEKEPPIGLGNVGVRDYDFNLYNGYGRVTYLRYTQSF
ncbi:TonB-dependent receptor [Kangiella sediminilitoris]|uniref:TonB-dependent receptor n=1 Tax=Kangiella sediminilitoris TaxID=1144748 RepID=A0A1B3B8F3_9GAMM|nr:TonB-dependent receptor [Kangiella sediminilitoris]AOE49051.1 TonB-dependent receptor [Kangiella sediminilitoris]